MSKELSEEAKDIIYACRDSIAPGVFSKQPPSRRVTLDGIDMLMGYEPSQEVMQELVDAGLLAHIGQGTYYVVEPDRI